MAVANTISYNTSLYTKTFKTTCSSRKHEPVELRADLCTMFYF